MQAATQSSRSTLLQSTAWPWETRKCSKNRRSVRPLPSRKGWTRFSSPKHSATWPIASDLEASERSRLPSSCMILLASGTMRPEVQKRVVPFETSTERMFPAHSYTSPNSWMQAAQVVEIERGRFDLDVLERDRGEFGLGVSERGLVADTQRIAQDGCAWPAMRVVRYAVLVP